MIKQILHDVLAVETDMLYCDHCGEGLARQPDNTEAVKKFITYHDECVRPRNKNLNFLKKAPRLKI